jgi:hypothetical protein
MLLGTIDGDRTRELAGLAVGSYDYLSAHTRSGPAALYRVQAQVQSRRSCGPWEEGLLSNAVEIAATLTQRQRQALAILAQAERPLRNKDFHGRFETDGRRTTGWAKALGPCTKARDHDDWESLWARGLVTVKDNCSYTIRLRGARSLPVIGSVAMRAKVRPVPSCADDAPPIGSEAGSGYSTPKPQAERLPEQSWLPNSRLIDLGALSDRARAAVACSYCFTSDRAREWKRVPRRPADRPDDVAFAPWFGRRYPSTTPRVAIMLLNPGHKAALHKLKRRDLGHQLRDGVIAYEDYLKHLTPLVEEWGSPRGAVVRCGVAPVRPDRWRVGAP